MQTSLATRTNDKREASCLPFVVGPKSNGYQLTYVYAMSGNGAIAAPILSSVCVVSLLLSRIFLKEKLTKKQYLFIGIIIVGILMLAVLEGE